MRARPIAFVIVVAPILVQAQLHICAAGGVGDGHASACGNNAPSGIARTGGMGYGHAVQCGASVGSSVAFLGGSGDGHTVDCGGTPANNGIFAGAAGDGADLSCGATPSNNALFGGGAGDGARPRTLADAATVLHQDSGEPVERCLSYLQRFLLQAYRVEDATGKALFAFKLHQFIAGGGKVYATLEPPGQRAVTLDGQQFVGGDDARRRRTLSRCAARAPPPPRPAPSI